MAYITHCLYHAVAIRWTLAVNLFCNISQPWAWHCQWDEELAIWCMSGQGECIVLPKRAPAAVKAVTWKVETWPIGLDWMKTYPSWPFHFITHHDKLRRIQCWGYIREAWQNCSFLRFFFFKSYLFFSIYKEAVLKNLNRMILTNVGNYLTSCVWMKIPQNIRLQNYS